LVDYRRILAGSAIAGYSPASEGDLRLWLDASFTGGFSLSGTQVLSWASRARGFTMSKAPSGGPAYSATSWDGVRPCVTFNSSGYTDVRANSVAGLTDFVGNNAAPATIVYRVATINATAGGCVWQSYSVGGGYSAIENQLATSHFDIFWSSGGAHATGSATIASVTKYTHSTVLSSNNAVAYLNNSVDITSIAFTPATPTDLAIGGNAFTGSQGFNAKIPEVLVFASALDSSAIARIVAYLAAKWP
jgi:hypothetical protein